MSAAGSHAGRPPYPRPREKTASGRPQVLTVDDWITQVAKRGNAFYEHQVIYSVDHMAHLWSTYEIRETPEGKATVRCINSMQAVSDGSQWRLVEILWQAETPEETIPSKYLP
jgi:hypothetical protein